MWGVANDSYAKSSRAGPRQSLNARRKLEVDVQNLEAKRKLVEVAQASSDYVFDDSQLARAKDLINDIRTRLDVAAKLANADVNVQTEIPLNESAPADY